MANVRVHQKRRVVLRNVRGQAVLEVDAVYAYIPGLWITPVPEFTDSDAPAKYRVTHMSGMMVGGMFDSVDAAIDALHEFNGGAAKRIRWTQPLKELRQDPFAFTFFGLFRQHYG